MWLRALETGGTEQGWLEMRQAEYCVLRVMEDPGSLYVCNTVPGT